jgi:hypothetical protein
VTAERGVCKAFGRLRERYRSKVERGKEGVQGVESIKRIMVSKSRCRSRDGLQSSSVWGW